MLALIKTRSNKAASPQPHGAQLLMAALPQGCLFLPPNQRVLGVLAAPLPPPLLDKVSIYVLHSSQWEKGSADPQLTGTP